MSRIIDGETWFRDLGGLDVSYHSETPFGRLDYRYTTECILGMIFVTWCIVNIYCHVTLCYSCHIIIVSNDTSHPGIKTTS